MQGSGRQVHRVTYVQGSGRHTGLHTCGVLVGTQGYRHTEALVGTQGYRHTEVPFVGTQGYIHTGHLAVSRGPGRHKASVMIPGTDRPTRF